MGKWRKRWRRKGYSSPSPGSSENPSSPIRSSTIKLPYVVAAGVAAVLSIAVAVYFGVSELEVNSSSVITGGASKPKEGTSRPSKTIMAFAVGVWSLLVATGVGAATPSARVLLRGDLTILINNDLQGPESPHSSSGVVLLGGYHSYTEASAGCQALGEQLWSPELKTASIQKNLDYYQYYHGGGDRSHKDGKPSSLFWIGSAQDGISKNTNVVPRTMDASGAISSAAGGSAPSPKLQALCTQTAPYSTQSSQNTTQQWQIAVEANNQTLTGYRDRLSFRFFGIRYAPQPKRFTYSTPFSGSGEEASALQYGSQCIQGSSAGSEDCLFLNIWTPYLPESSSKGGKDHHKKNEKNLRPVGIWIHGGAFTGGTANDATFDGGNIVSRGDMVLVAINYRLSTLGFLALRDGVTKGNFGLADQINALDWVREHIHNFGGDPDRITVFGQSAGAASVRALMASPKARGKFSGAILLSNLGGLNYGTTYSKYYTIDEQLAVAGHAILNATNCTEAPSQVDCLRTVPAHTLSSKLPAVARYMVVDGTYLTAPELLPLANNKATHRHPPINLMMGITRDDGGPFITFPKTTNKTAYLISQGWDPSLISSSSSSTNQTATPSAASSFSLPLSTATQNLTLNLYNTTSRLATDGIFRCVDQATVYSLLHPPTHTQSLTTPRIFYYEFDRTYQTTGWPGTDVCHPPSRSAAHPHGDPSKEYFKCHSGELYYVFGNLARQGLPARDGKDLPFERMVLDAFAAFVRTGDPNVDGKWARARGFLLETAGGGRWEPSVRGKLTMRVLDWPAYQSGFRELEECKGLGLGLEEYYG